MKCRTERPPGIPPIQSGGGFDIAEHTTDFDPHPGYQLEAGKGVANGYASLNGSGVVPAAQLPQATLTAAGIASISEIHGFATPDLLGTGADANMIINGTHTLTGDRDYLNLTVPAGTTLVTAGFRVRVRNTLTWNGTISCNGTDASGATPGTGGGAGGGVYAEGTNGAPGMTANEGSSATSNNGNWGALHGTNLCRGGNGGASGTGQPGGSAGNVNTPDPKAGLEHAGTWETGYLHGVSVLRLRPGTGGGSGGASTNTTSGAGGGGGGVCAVFARRIAGSGGSHTATGGKGGNASSNGGAGAGGGGGGGGGIVICRYVELLPGASLPTVSVAGGAGGTKVGAGINGASGNQGFSSVRRLVGV